MNLRQLQYAVALSKHLSFSQVAEQLNISQPALSKQILSLEKELGIKLFNRDTSPITVTPAGEHFVTLAQDILDKEDRLLRSMEQFRSGEAGTLTIGTTPFRSVYLVEDMIKKVREKFPQIRVHLHEEGGDKVRQDAAEGKFDFAIVNLPVDTSVLNIYPLEEDRLVLVCSDVLPNDLPSCGTIDFEDCRNLPFVVVGAAQEMRQLFDKLCAQANIHPVIAVEAVNLMTSWAIAKAGIAAALLPWQFVKTMPHDGLKILDIAHAPYIRKPVAVTHRHHTLSPAARYALELLTNQSGCTD